MQFNALKLFQKEFKRLSKKYSSLPDDLQIFKEVLEIEPLGSGKHSHIIAKQNSIYIIKSRLFCSYLRGSSMRIVYAFDASLQKIDFIELFYKGNKPNHDHQRVVEYFENLD
jgi:hypothetical protein